MVPLVVCGNGFLGVGSQNVCGKGSLTSRVLRNPLRDLLWRKESVNGFLKVSNGLFNGLFKESIISVNVLFIYTITIYIVYVYSMYIYTICIVIYVLCIYITYMYVM